MRTTMFKTAFSDFRKRMATILGLDSSSASAVGATFCACCSNVVILEQLIRLDPSCTSLVTFCQFAFIAIEKFFSETRCLTKPRKVPFKRYFTMVLVFFASSFLNNYALSYDIPMPLHMIFKSASLLSNMILGIYLLKRSYSFRKYAAVTVITIGIIACTAASSGLNDDTDWQNNRSMTLTFSMTQIIGILILIVALFLSSMMGILQEQVTAQYGKHPGEMMFYIHALALPIFMLFSSQMQESFFRLMSTERATLSLGMPVGIVALLLNVITQYVCISSVFKLSTECSSLTVTLVVTLRKFVSLLISIFYFGNDFTNQHWMGTVLVFVGTLLFLDSPAGKSQKSAKVAKKTL